MKVFITGASGFIGSYLVKELAERGDEIVCLTRDLRRMSLKTRDNVNYVEGDITKPNSFEKFFENVEVIYHLAGYVKHKPYSARVAYDINVIGTKNIYDLAKKYAVKKILYLSSAGIYHPTQNIIANEDTPLSKKFINTYAYSKYLGYIETQKYVQEGVNIISILPASVYGDGSPLFVDLLNFLVNKRIFFKTLLDKRLSMVYVDDVVQAILVAEKKSDFGETYLLSNANLEMAELLKIIEDFFDIRLYKLNVPEFFISTAITSFDLVSKILNKAPASVTPTEA